MGEDELFTLVEHGLEDLNRTRFIWLRMQSVAGFCECRSASMKPLSIVTGVQFVKRSVWRKKRETCS